MLEIRGVTKIYRSKAGIEVKALDNVSVSFPETGMVFILGKSGSGKSTLLNVIGGLDSCDGGEFIIKGKSSRDFVGSDFDAYRNTFIGFIFQEYNILDDFSVGANIALALELQGKRASGGEVSSILSQVDLLNFAKRKPNELSGGQKQRVAIARALVKDPQIIMADEPTGALDSGTGKQIFDTLKELSKTKLVIVVSHDRDFAERYGDRIIEMKDGKIDSDVTKHAEEATVLSGGVHKMNDGILKIKSGYELTREDLLRINEYLRAQEGDVFISGDRRINDTVRTAAGITSDGKTSSFKDTTKNDVPLKRYEKQDSKFIRSSLPIKNAVKMGANSLGHKKFRLVLTIFLSLIAFALFGFADTMGSYNKFVAATDSIIDSGIKNASVTLGVQNKWIYGDEENIYYYDESFNEDDILLLEQRTGLDFLPVYNGSTSGMGGSISFTSVMGSLSNIGSGTAYTGYLSGVAAPTAQELAALGFAIYGEMPKEKDEIAISKLAYEQLNFTGFKNQAFDEEVEAGKLTVENGQNGIIGKHLTLRFDSWQGSMERTFRITAVVDTQFDYDRYGAFIPSEEQNGNSSEDMNILDMILMEEMQNAISYGFHGIGYMTEDGVKELSKNGSFQTHLALGIHTNGYNLIFEPNSESIEKDPGGMTGGFIQYGEQYSYYRLAKSDVLSSLKVEYLDGRTSLGEGEYLLPLEVKENLVRVESADITEVLFAACAEALGVPVASLNTQKLIQNDLAGLLDYYSVEKYVEENFAALKAEHKAHWQNRLDSAPAYDDGLLHDLLVEEICGFGWNDILPDANMHKEASCEGIYRAFFEALTGKTFHASYTDSFFRSSIQEYMNVYFDSESISVSIYQAEGLLSRFEAAKAIFENGLDYTGDTFIDNVVNLYGNISDEERESWKNGYVSKDEAVQRYAEYMRTYRRNEYGMEYSENVFGGKTCDDISEQAAELLRKAAGVTAEDAVRNATLSSLVWENDGEVKTLLSAYKLAGFYSSAQQNVYIEGMIVSDGLYNDFMRYAKENGYGYQVTPSHVPGMYAFAIAPMPTSRAQIENLVNLSYDVESAFIFRMQNPVMDTLDNFNEFIEIGAKVFMWIGVGFAVFSALMLMNFISVSISYKKREIGILRAVGAKSSDVYKIFFSESLIIALINYVLALIVTVAGTMVFNGVVRNEGINVTLLNFGLRQVILMLLISIGVAAIASFLPVYKIARKKPVDAIKDK